MIRNTAEALAALGVGPLTARAAASARRGWLLRRGRRVHARRGRPRCGPSSIGCARSRASWAGTRSISSRALPGCRTCSTSPPPTTGCLPASQPWPRPTYLLGEIRIYSLNARNPLKGQGQQPLHSDVPRVHATDWRVVNSMVMLDDMTPDNGPTRVVPGSHKWVPINVPDVNMARGHRDQGNARGPGDHARPTRPLRTPRKSA